MNSVADLELRSVICVPLVRIRAGQNDATSARRRPATRRSACCTWIRGIAAADLAGGNRELLQTLAIEASTVLENARLLEEERRKRPDGRGAAPGAHHPAEPAARATCRTTGWLRACGSSVASHQVGGDYYDVTEVNPHCWSAVVADVSGKGVGSALLASLLQGALITATDVPGRRSPAAWSRLNQFLLDRTGGEKYATVFYSLLDDAGKLSYVNAAHCPPLVVRAGGERVELDATGMPVGMLEDAEFALGECSLAPGDKLVIYSDGVTEAQNNAGGVLRQEAAARGRQRRAHGQSCRAVHDAIQEAVTAFTEGAPQSDDITVLVVEFRG